MGAEFFIRRGTGHSAETVFKELKSQAQYDHGHSGYTGTIAEKDSFIMLESPVIKAAYNTVGDWIGVSAYIEDEYWNDDKIRDKWGPAGCIQLSEKEWVFFGWASS